MKFIVNVLVILVSSCPFAYAIDGGRLSNSKDTAVHSTVRVHFQTQSGRHSCSGTLVSKDIVITAAHCMILAGQPLLDPKRPDLFFVSMMSFPDFGGIADGYKAAVLDYRAHEEFKRFDEYPYLINDIAVLKIRASDFKFNPSYAKLSRLEDATLSQKLIIAAFGASVTDPDLGQPLRQVEMSLKNLDDENKIFSVGWNPSEKKGLNLGDSGGPVYLRDFTSPVLIGVISTGDGFTHVSRYKDWIMQATQTISGELPEERQ